MRMSFALLLGVVMVVVSACALPAGETARPAPMPLHALGARQGA
jgi:hypothetical protein